MSDNIYRNERIDILRGIAIILVIVGHGIHLLIEKGYVGSNTGGGIYDAIYAVHMPLFFVISGYVYKSNSDKISKIIAKNMITFYIPYLFFSYLYWFERIIASGLFGIRLTRTDYTGGIKLFWLGDGMTWFLLSMMLVKIVFNVLDTYISDLCACTLFSIVFWLSCIFPQYEILYYLQWGVFFCAGYALSKYHFEMKQKSAMSICALNMLLIGIERYFLCGLDRFVKLFIGISVFAIYLCVRRIPNIKVLAECGQSSMVIYMVHGLSHFLCYYIMAEIVHIRDPFIIICFMLVLQLLTSFLVISLFTKVKCLHWIQIIFYPYKYISDKTVR